MDEELRLLDYIGSVPSSTSNDEFKDQLSAFHQRTLLAVCKRLDVAILRKTPKKTNLMHTLVKYRSDSMNTEIPTTSAKITPAKDKIHPPKDKTTPAKAKMTQSKGDPEEVMQVLQGFPPNGDIQELRNQLCQCRYESLRMACVGMDIRPQRNNYSKPNFAILLAQYWKDTNTTNERENVPPKAAKLSEPYFNPGEETQVKKRTRVEEMEQPKKKTKRLECTGAIFEEKPNVMAKSLEKAKVVQEWASAIEVLARVDGSAGSISSIRRLIDGVVESAAGDL
ncbi:hypothetical protein PHMEG_000728 [Phytophthora megakarya]|uniref:Uncharacterized protein n=1 Tax=Phytophthora megakarya TaxID=4795 RepID=A0A225X4U6_9STRA|nr:hypothetical protein PHMEG_000728 [Phytophthora megakarya]